jgi:hypothetical protein
MIDDPIVREIHETRRRIMEECGGDVERLIALLKAGEEQAQGSARHAGGSPAAGRQTQECCLANSHFPRAWQGRPRPMVAALERLIRDFPAS